MLRISLELSIPAMTEKRISAIQKLRSPDSVLYFFALQDATPFNPPSDYGRQRAVESLSGLVLSGSNSYRSYHYR